MFTTERSPVNPHCEKGFGLIEMLITVGIMAVVGLGTATLLVDSLAAQNHAENKSEIQAKFREIEDLLAHKELCAQAFVTQSGQKISSKAGGDFEFELKSIVYPGATDTVTLLEANSEFRGIEFRKVNLKSLSKLDGKASITNLVTGAEIMAEKYLMELSVNIGKNKRSLASGPAEYKGQHYRFIGLFDTAGDKELINCYHDRSDAYICEQIFDGQYDETKVPHCQINTMGIANRIKPKSGGGDFTEFRVGNPSIEKESVVIRSTPTGRRLGIGVTKPDGRLHVKGYSYFDGHAHVTKNMEIEKTLRTKGIQLTKEMQVESGSMIHIRPNARLLNEGDTHLKWVEVAGFAHVRGAMTVDKSVFVGKQLSARSIVQRSDRRFKGDIEDLPPNQSERLHKLRPKSYHYLDDEKKRVHYGVIAQELQEIYPELVVEDENGYLLVDYQSLAILLLSEVQSLKQENQVLSRQLQSEIRALRDEVRGR